MRVADFHFDLPESLIARHPLAERRASRLLQLDGPTGALRHGQFTDVLEQLRTNKDDAQREVDEMKAQDEQARHRPKARHDAGW